MIGGSAPLTLPTRFGNAIRSFEVYSRIIYGLEAIDGWPRLLAVIPADYRQAIDDAKAQVDFWVNIWMGSLLIWMGSLLIWMGSLLIWMRPCPSRRGWPQGLGS
jgi:hypothetical protein